MSQSQTELEKLRAELETAKRSATHALLELQSEKEVVDWAKTAHAASQAAASSAKTEMEAVRHELKKSLEVEAKLKSQVQRGKEELKSTPLDPNLFFLYCFSPNDLCLSHRVMRRSPEAT